MESTQIPQPDPDRAFIGTKVPLFSAGQIAVAAFFGTLVASGWLARANLIALGRHRRGDLALLLGVVVTLGLMALAFVLPEDMPSLIFTFPQIILALHLAKREFDAQQHRAERRSNWAVAGICGLTLLIVLTVVVTTGMALGAAGLITL